MKRKSLKYYTLRYLFIAILINITVWAASFYWLIVEEVNDNIDDGLKSSKNRILDAVKTDPDLLKVNEFGIGQYKITPLPDGEYSDNVHIFNFRVFMKEENEAEPVRMLQTIFESSEKYYQLNIYASNMESDEFLGNLLIALLFLYLFLIVSILLINHFVLKKAWKPFYNTLNKLNNYKLDSRKSFEKSQSEIEEFNRLEEELFVMVYRNELIYEQQNQFIGNASHEIQTPLAIASNKLELISEENEISENIAQKINEVSQILNRLKRLNRTLLMLSKIENRQFAGKEHVIFNQLINSVIVELADLSLFKNSKISVTEKGVFSEIINPELARVLVMNLIKNAIIHSSENSKIEILIDEYEINFCNPGETPLSENKIFERFHKESANNSSSGLGLAIVRSIVDTCPELSVDYEFKNTHIFSLRKRFS